MNAPARIDAAAAQPFRFNVDQFVALHEQGVFADFTKTELIAGEIICMNAQWSRHARVKTRLATELAIALRTLLSPLEPLTEVSVRLSDDTLPEPDIILTTYRGDGPVPLATVALIVEVSDTTLANDIGRKAALYASAGISEYWVIDLNDNLALIHEQPSAEGYHAQSAIKLGEALQSASVKGLTVPTAGLIE